MIGRLTDVVLITTGFQLLLLAAIVLLRLPVASTRRSLLAAFLLTKVFLVLRWFSLRFGLVRANDWPTLYLTTGAAFFVLAPVLYLYIKATCERRFRLGSAQLVHALPAAVMAAFAALCSAVAGGLSTGSSSLDHLIVARFWTVFWCANLIQILCYIVAMFAIVRRSRLARPELGPAAGADVGWMHGLLLVILLHWIFVASRSTLALLGASPPVLLATLDLFSIAIFLFFATALVARGLIHARKLPEIDEVALPNGAPPSLEDLEDCARRAGQLMSSDKPHLDSSLGLDQLAARLGTPAWILSRALNTVLGRNFFHFINSYRVEEAKARLANPSRRNDTMLRILHESGFNSKSTFNDAFKRETGLTPSEYRRHAIGQGH